MPAPIRAQLNANQTKFAQAIALGSDYTQAYQQSFRCKDIPIENIRVRASKLANNPHIKAFARSFIEGLNISAIDNAQQFMLELIGDIKACRAEKKYSALAALTRIRGQVLGIIRENVNIHTEQTLSDAELVRRVAGGDEKKVALLSAVLASDNQYKQPAN